jgi:hypothetical protein
MVIMARQGKLDLLEAQDNKVIKDFQVLLDKKDHQELLELQER